MLLLNTKLLDISNTPRDRKRTQKWELFSYLGGWGQARNISQAAATLEEGGILSWRSRRQYKVSPAWVWQLRLAMT